MFQGKTRYGLIETLIDVLAGINGIQTYDRPQGFRRATSHAPRA
jgi:hypothetical protein